MKVKQKKRLYVAFEVSAEMKRRLQDLADHDHRKLAEFVRLKLERIANGR